MAKRRKSKQNDGCLINALAYIFSFIIIIGLLLGTLSFIMQGIIWLLDFIFVKSRNITIIVGIIAILTLLFVIMRKKRAKSISNTEELTEWEKWQAEEAAHPKYSTRQVVNDQAEEAPTQKKPANIIYGNLLPAAVNIVLETGMASTSMLQRRLDCGYSRAARLLDQMEAAGIVGELQGSAPRSILITKAQWEELRPRLSYEVDANQIIKDEENWRREQSGLSPVEYELDKIDHMEGRDFEHWCADLLRKNGFTDVSVTQGSGDQGVDVLAKKDGIKYAVQCKCYSSDLGNTPVQEVHAGKAFYGCQVGAVMTNRHFTKGAQELAEKTGILLWDRDKLSEMLNV